MKVFLSIHSRTSRVSGVYVRLQQIRFAFQINFQRDVRSHSLTLLHVRVPLLDLGTNAAQRESFTFCQECTFHKQSYAHWRSRFNGESKKGSGSKHRLLHHRNAKRWKEFYVKRSSKIDR